MDMSNSKTKKLKTGAIIAGAAAALMLAGCAGPGTKPMSQSGPVKCSGINSCKGTSECATAKSACKGQNKCKGTGWVFAKSADLCKKKGGVVLSAGASNSSLAAVDASENLASLDDNKAYRR
ncbi:hypothetical protein DA717_09805 [Piscirickettsiaceae bacterium NZ-RLO2]|nr:hypothetical protein A0O36_02148 [Piscirickettsiaceae bacterium NZ-RLO1]RNC77525.1 hypothetical protein DA717_09805 [Piscirickettsiaceae bacterium NZ-RLO2]